MVNYSEQLILNIGLQSWAFWTAHFVKMRRTFFTIEVNLKTQKGTQDTMTFSTQFENNYYDSQFKLRQRTFLLCWFMWTEVVIHYIVKYREVELKN